LKNRGVQDVLIAVCDGLKGLPESINTVWEKTLVQSCVIHLLRNTFRYAARQDWDSIARDLRPIYTAVNEPMARERFHEFGDKWRGKYPAAVALWGRAWSEFVTFLDYDVEIRKVLCSTNAIESLNARYRRAVNAKGHFPTDLLAGWLGATAWVIFVVSRRAGEAVLGVCTLCRRSSSGAWTGGYCAVCRRRAGRRTCRSG
jgi:putative transposase